MSRKRYSQMPAASAVADADVVCLSQGGSSRRATIAQLLANAPSGWHDAKRKGCVADGVTDDSAALIAIAALGNAAINIPPGTYKISANVTFPADQTLHFVPGAILSVDSGKTVTIPGHIVAGISQQIFDGAGHVDLTGISPICAAWFGMPMNGSEDDAPAVNKAIESVGIGYASVIQLPPTPNGVSAPRFYTQVRVTRSHIIEGSGSVWGTSGTFCYVVTPVGLAEPVCGFIVEASGTSPNGGAGTFAVIRNLSIYSLGRLSIARYQTAHTYAAGSYVSTGSLDAAADAPAGHVEPRYFLYTTLGGTTGGAEPSNPGPTTAKGPGSAVTDSGGVVWKAQLHCGIYAKVCCFIENVLIQGFTNAGVHFQASVGYSAPAGPGAANGGGMDGGFITQCGVGIATVGSDANGINFTGIQLLETGYQFYGGTGLTITGACAIYEDGEIGCRYYNCVIDTVHGGRCVYASGAGGNSGAKFDGMHTEGASYPIHIISPSMWVGGATGPTAFTTDSSGQIFTSLTASPIRWENDCSRTGVAAGVKAGVNGGPYSLLFDTDDSGDVVGLIYGWGDIAGKWSMVEGSAFECFGFTTSLHALGGGLLLTPRPVANGEDQWITFTDVTALESSSVRGALRSVGDRVYLATDTASGRAGRIVSVEGYEGREWTTGLAHTVGEVFRPTAGYAVVADRAKRFRCTVAGTSAAGEPTWVTTTVNVSTTTDGGVTWLYVGDVPTYREIALI